MSKIMDLIDKKLKLLKKGFEYKFFGIVTPSDIIFASLTIYLVIFTHTFYKIASDSVFKNMDSELKNNLLFTFLFLFVFTYFFAILKWRYLKITNKEQRTGFWITIGIMFWILVSGAVFINTQFGDNDIHLVLRDDLLNNDGQMYTILNGGQIHCFAKYGKYLAYNKFVLCKTEPELIYVNHTFVEFTLQNGSQIKLDENELHNRLEFRIPEKAEGIRFSLSGYDANKTDHYFSGGINSNFLSPEDEDIYEERLITLYIWLIGAIFLIPTMMHNLNKLYDAK